MLLVIIQFCMWLNSEFISSLDWWTREIRVWPGKGLRGGGVVKEETACPGLPYVNFQGQVQGEPHSRQKEKEKRGTWGHP